MTPASLLLYIDPGMITLPWWVEERLLSQRQIVGECWNFTGATIEGYGAQSVKGCAYLVHRLSWIIWKGEIPAGHHIHHVCENRLCFNPAHLEALTPGEHRRYHSVRFHHPTED